MSEVLPEAPSSALALRAGFNTFIFWIIWETLRLSPLYDAAGETVLWSLSWLASSVVAHFVHRRFTFDGRRNVRTTVLGAISVYAVGMMGSTLSFDVMLDLLTTFPIRLLFLLNIGIWGLFTWASMRWFVFGYTTIEDE